MKEKLIYIKLKIRQYMINPKDIKHDLMNFTAENSDKIIKILIKLTNIATIITVLAIVLYALSQSITIQYIPKEELP